MPNNTISDLNNHLFAQLDRLAQPNLSDGEMKTELERAKAVSTIADNIIDSSALRIKAAQVYGEYGRPVLDMLPQVGTGPVIQHKPEEETDVG